jgi:BNR/Asp-box repeat
VKTLTRVLGAVLCGWSLSPTAVADLASTQLGVANGDDWEPAIAADGLNVYAYWPHYLANGSNPVNKDSQGTTCPGKSKTWTSYMYFQKSTDGGVTWSPITIPHCPINGNTVDAQIVIGPNHRIIIANMDGAADETPIYVNYSDDYGVTWHTPVNVAPTQGGDHPWLLVNVSGEVTVGSEWAASKGTARCITTIAHIADLTTGVVDLNVVPPPSSIVVNPHIQGHQTDASLTTGGGIDSHGNSYYVFSDALGPAKVAKGDTYFWLARSSSHFAPGSVTESIIDQSGTALTISGEGWDYFGGSIQMVILPRPGMGTDRIVVAFNLSTALYPATAVAQRIYTRYSDDNGLTWSPRVELTTAPVGTMHGFPSLAATANGVRVIWQDNRVNDVCTSQSSCGTWNNYTRFSVDGATNWTAETLIKATNFIGAVPAGITTAGFAHPYGDYTSSATDGSGNYFSIMGEGKSYAGPGTIYFLKY